jgi:glycosyltransferase involved in cell wall biosynthesis
MFLAVSAATARGNGLPDNDLPHRVVQNFIPDNIDTEGDLTDPRLGRLPQGDYLLFAGDLSHDKGIDVLLKAYAELSNPPPLVLIGRRCADTPRDIPMNVLMFDKWPHSTLIEAWRRSLFALAPSTWGEPCGTVVLEAMAMGRAVIASRTGGLPDLVVHEETGLLVTPNDPLSLQQAMQRLLDDRDLCKRMGKAGKERVQEFCAKTIVPQIESVYEEVIRKYGNFSTSVASLASRS